METVVISLGGSVLVPGKPDAAYIRSLRSLLLSRVDRQSFILVTGGGRTARQYQEAYRASVEHNQDAESDHIGIAATRLNAELLRAACMPAASRHIITNPEIPIKLTAPITIAGGWKPGFSTDYVAVFLAKRYSSSLVINLSNIDYVYSADPASNPEARAFESLDWDRYLTIFEDTWKPGMHIPFDTVAARFARDNNIRVIVTRGTALDNVESILDSGTAKGTYLG